MLEIRQTQVFADWLDRLKDRHARHMIAQRIVRLRHGHSGDVQPVGEGVSELRLHHGPGYRLYFVQHGTVLIILLCGGDKSSQQKDIRKAKALAADLEKEK
ncbi:MULTISPECIES: type II toxin-antitoxin system RelE/ParE family toxin [unclassified Phyllobacterium]|jgi:putative addiction module killer protein|uniref:type II toxin-antitoxin system RelE/ParE family toxin n=1 Tax=unclassified Phyllobacterium TaxID=2638441 RepID=UPI0031FC646B|nr:type II toxin-antitoxin system RelE/ParE family toxin [Phyllobacterium sp.]